MQEENGPVRSWVVHHHSSERDVLVDLEEADIGFLFLLGGVLGVSRRDCDGCEHAKLGASGGYCRGADKMAAMEVDPFRTGVHGQPPWFECHLLRRCNVSAALACCSRRQYGGCLRCRCAVAASTHHMRSSAKRGNARSSAWPLSPMGSPSADKVCPIGPTAIVLETTTIPISESVPCQALAARAPDRRPPEELAIAAGRQNHSSRKWSVRFFRPGWTPQLYSPVTKMKPRAERILSASSSNTS